MLFFILVLLRSTSFFIELTMRVILLAAVVLLNIGCLVRAEPRSKCLERCDVSACPSPSCPSGYVPDRCGCCLVCARAEGEACGRAHDLACGDGLECKHPAGKRLSKGVCQCRYNTKVCASDANTYANVCQLKAASRKALQQGLPGLSTVHKGPCKNSRGKLSPFPCEVTQVSYVISTLLHSCIHSWQSPCLFASVNKFKVSQGLFNISN